MCVRKPLCFSFIQVYKIILQCFGLRKTIWNGNLTFNRVLGVLRRFTIICFPFFFSLTEWDFLDNKLRNNGREQEGVNYDLWLLWNLIFNLFSSHLSLCHWNFASISVRPFLSQMISLIYTYLCGGWPNILRLFIYYQIL